jgi:hypothetical protein
MSVNERSIMSKKKRAKPTMAEMVKTVSGMLETQARLIEWIEFMIKKMNILDSILGSYIEMRGASPDLKKFMEEQKKKEEEAKEDASEK